VRTEPARLVCDDWGRCWRRHDERYRYRDFEDDDGYGDPEWGDRRPPTKWERKGFCPPGQAKKGNC
jgi:hypothetical protein